MSHPTSSPKNNSANSVIVSVITATYNPDVAAFQRTLDSVSEQHRQTCGAVEHVLVDGNSTNGVVECIKQQAAMGSVGWWCSESDCGVYHAFNKGIEHARCEWLLFLGAGDTFASGEVIEQMLPILASTPPDIRVVYGRAWSQPGILIDQNDDWATYRDRVRCEGAYFAHQAVFHRRTLFADYGGYDETFRILGDNELLRRELMLHEARSVDIVIAIQPFGGMSSTPRSLPLFVRESLRITRRYPLQASFHHRLTVQAEALAGFLETRFASQWLRWFSWIYLRTFLWLWAPRRTWRRYFRV